MSTTIKTISDIIRFYGVDRISNAVILPVGGDDCTGSTSYWIPAADLDISNPEDTDIEIVTQLPDFVMIDANGGAWKIAIA